MRVYGDCSRNTSAARSLKTAVLKDKAHMIEGKTILFDQTGVILHCTWTGRNAMVLRFRQIQFTASGQRLVDGKKNGHLLVVSTKAHHASAGRIVHLLSGSL